MRRFLRKVVPGGLAAAYLESEWSFAQVRGVHAPTICAFGKTPNTVVSVGADGAFLVSRFADGGECERVAFRVEIKISRRLRAESSRRPPRHRRDACSIAWRC